MQFEECIFMNQDVYVFVLYTCKVHSFKISEANLVIWYHPSNNCSFCCWQPGPHPGMRASVEMQKQHTSGRGMMEIMLPMYAVGIFAYLIYTLFKVSMVERLLVI